MAKYTAFCQQTDGRGTIWISDVEASSISEAAQNARDLCATEWGYEFHDVHCLGLAEGDINIVHWEDLNT